MLNDPLAAALSKILNAERVGKRDVLLRSSSTMIKKVLAIMNNQSYVGSLEDVNDGKGSVLRLHLLGNINSCGVVKPRFSTKRNEFEKWEKRYLPAKDFGIILVSTPKGLMTHYEAKKQGIGGKLIAYCY